MKRTLLSLIILISVNANSVDEFPVERGGIADDMKRRLGDVEPELHRRGCLRLAKRLAKAEYQDTDCQSLPPVTWPVS